MAGTVEQKLAAEGITLAEPRSPIANYVPFVRSGNLLFVSGQVCMKADGTLIAKGKLGGGVTDMMERNYYPDWNVVGAALAERTHRIEELLQKAK